MIENRTLKLILLDDIKAKFKVDQERSEYIVNESISVLSDTPGILENTNDLSNTFKTIDNMENKINSVSPKLNVNLDKSVKSIKDSLKTKLNKSKKDYEFKNISFDDNPERANLEDTLVLNAAILKRELARAQKNEKVLSISNRSKKIVFALYLVLFVCTLFLPYLI